MKKSLESPLDCKVIQPVHPKGNQSWIFIGRTDAKAQASILWPPDVKNWLICKDLAAGKDWRQEKGMTEDELVGWHHWLKDHEFEQALGDGKGQGNLACCHPWGCKGSDMTECLNNNNNTHAHTHTHTHMYNGILLSHKKWPFAICSDMNGLGGYYAKWNKSDRVRLIL